MGEESGKRARRKPRPRAGEVGGWTITLAQLGLHWGSQDTVYPLLPPCSFLPIPLTPCKRPHPHSAFQLRSTWEGRARVGAMPLPSPSPWTLHFPPGWELKDPLPGLVAV